MKSLRPILAVFLVAALTSVHAADSKKSSAKSSATPKPTPDKSGLPDPVGQVNGEKISKADLLKEFGNAIQAVGKKESDLTPEQKQQGYHAVLDDIIIDRILRKQSADEKIDDAEVDKDITQLKAQFPTEDKLNEALKKTGQTLDKVKENIRVALQQQKWIESQIADKIAVSDADAKSFYDTNTDKFKEPDSVRASHILILVPEDAKPEVVAEKQKAAQAAKDRIVKGEDFAKVAADVSEDPGSKATGGDLNYFAKGSMVPEFEETAFKLKVGEISDPVKTKYGWHIIKVTDKKDAHTVTFDEAKDKIVQYLKNNKKKAAVNDLIASLREKSDAKVFLPPLVKADAPAEQAPPGADSAPMPAPSNP